LDPSLILILGGARSGKSSFAEDLAQKIAHHKPVLYLATATPIDAEMAKRIQQHQQDRPPHWLTVESPVYVSEAVRESLKEHSMPVVLLDCLTLLTSNWLLNAEPGSEETTEKALREEISTLLSDLKTLGIVTLIVSNEVGMGIVPAYPLGRQYRDLLGRLNQWIASQADQVFWLAAGIPIEIKHLAYPR
jgi:adenosylcobinamide kinase/adenosylcobinamide-phosphate guanylyltransferase